MVTSACHVRYICGNRLYLVHVGITNAGIVLSADINTWYIVSDIIILYNYILFSKSNNTLFYMNIYYPSVRQSVRDRKFVHT